MKPIAIPFNAAINCSRDSGPAERSKLLVAVERFRRPILLVLLFVAAAFLAAAFAVHYVHGEDPAYLWDYRGYWEEFRQYGHGFETDFKNTFYKYAKAVWIEQYNPTPITPLLPFEILLGGTRAIYIGCLVVCYLIPCAAAVARLATRIGFSNWHPRYGQTLIYFALACIYPPFWSPTLRGFPDIIGLLPIAVASIVVIEAPVPRTHEIRRGIVLGLLLWLPFLFRRWYAYASIAFFVGAACLHLVEAITTAELRTPGNLRKLLARYAAAAAVIVLLVACVQGSLAWEALSLNYADIYSAYQVSLSDHVVRFWNYFGPFTLGLAVVGAIASVCTRQGRQYAAFALTNLAVFWLLFARVQVIEICHYLPIALWMFVLLCRGIAATLSTLSCPRLRTAVLSAIILVSATTFYGTYYRLQGFGMKAMAWVLPHDRIYGLKLQNYGEYRHLVDDLLLQLAGNNDQVSVISSSLIMADDLLDQLSDGKLHTRIIFASQVDKRDRFNPEELLAQYLVVCDPVQIHLNPAGQQVISVPAKLILAGTGIGSAYVKLPRSYALSWNVKAYIYKKIRAFTPEEVNDFFEQLYASYPDWRREYEGHLGKAVLSARISVGRGWGWVHLIDPETLFIHPGYSNPTVVDLPLALGPAGPEGKLAELSVRAMGCAKADGVDVAIKAPEGLLWSGTMLPGDKRVVSIAADVPGVSISVDPRSQPLCDHFMIRFPSPAGHGGS